jgi:hypothetical protein
MLQSHPAVVAEFELFQPGAKRERSFEAFVQRAGGRRQRFVRPALTFSYLDAIYGPRQGVDAVGFKLMYQDVRRNPYVLAYMRSRRVKVVHLVRSNLLDVVVSSETARARGSFHSSSDVEQVQVSLEPATVVARLRSLERKVRVARALLSVVRVPCVEVSYEGLVADPGGFTELLGFLGVVDSDAQLTTSLRKLNTVGKRETIGNYAEIEQALARTRFARFLE